MDQAPQDNQQPQRGRLPINREKHARLLRQQLSPAGEIFVDKLDAAIRRECETINNNAADAVQEIIAEHHLRTLHSIKTMNRLAEEWKNPNDICYFMLMNYSGILLSSGHYHKTVGELNPTGYQLLQIWRIYANKLLDNREVTREQIDTQEKNMLDVIAKTGRPRLSLLKTIKAALKK